VCIHVGLASSTMFKQLEISYVRVCVCTSTVFRIIYSNIYLCFLLKYENFALKYVSIILLPINFLPLFHFVTFHVKPIYIVIFIYLG
jgi:hypothetical protein